MSNPTAERTKELEAQLYQGGLDQRIAALGNCAHNSDPSRAVGPTATFIPVNPSASFVRPQKPCGRPRARGSQFWGSMTTTRLPGMRNFGVPATLQALPPRFLLKP